MAPLTGVVRCATTVQRFTRLRTDDQRPTRPFAVIPRTRQKYEPSATVLVMLAAVLGVW